VQATGVEARALVAAGAAAGFAAAYNTPFAAVLFVVEVVVGVVALETLAPVLVAVVLASSVSRALGDSGPLFGQHNFETQSTLELAAFALVGALAAVAGHGFLHLLSTVEGRYRHLVPTLPWRPALGALGTGLVLVVLPDVAGNGAEPLRLVLDARLGAGALALLLGAKVLATASSVGSGSPGGVFTPTMLLGGGVGALTAMGLHALGIPAGASGGYALVGMAAAVAGTTHAPIMAAVLAFEMTGDYAIVVPLMLATTVAVVVAQRLSPESLYTRELLARGVRWRLSVEGGRVVEREELVSNGEGI
jgi:CIC family chloride channel protein